MTDKFIPPPPSAEAIEAFIKRTSSGGGTWAEHIAAANAVDQPRVCRAEVERALALVAHSHLHGNSGAEGCDQCFRHQMYLNDRYGPPSDGPDPLRAEHQRLKDAVVEAGRQLSEVAQGVAYSSHVPAKYWRLLHKSVDALAAFEAQHPEVGNG